MNLFAWRKNIKPVLEWRKNRKQIDLYGEKTKKPNGEKYFDLQVDHQEFFQITDAPRNDGPSIHVNL